MSATPTTTEVARFIIDSERRSIPPLLVELQMRVNDIVARDSLASYNLQPAESLLSDLRLKLTRIEALEEITR